ncbi:PTS transporter subunit EIIC, partial [Escherichia coli]|uniref:PTS transporter subunit EIIC n=1 Tax=Escherichia coli TaxID=562 RepID=UPI003D3116CF
ARPENRHKIKGLLISGVIACVVGGTTEPLEFLFLFVAPVLYVIHALLTGLGFTIMAVLGVTIGTRYHLVARPCRMPNTTKSMILPSVLPM